MHNVTTNGRFQALNGKRLREKAVRPSRSVAASPLASAEGGFGVAIRFNRPILLIGIGSTGSDCAAHIVARLKRENNGILPANVEYVLIDADEPKSHWDPTHCINVHVAGAGTDPNAGRELIERHWREIRLLVSKRVDRLGQHVDARRSLGQTKRAIDVFLVGGPGGTSGGALDPMITLIHQVGSDRGIQHVLLYPVLLGAEIALHDPERPLEREQYDLIPATYGANLVKMIASITSRSRRCLQPPEGPELMLADNERVYAPVLLDRGNGVFDFDTNATFIRMAADALFLRGFTTASSYLASRQVDLFQTQVTGHLSQQKEMSCAAVQTVRLPRPAESTGLCVLVNPICSFAGEILQRFAALVFPHTYALPGDKSRAAKSVRLLDEEAANLRRYFGEGAPKLPQDPLKLAEFADQLANEESPWLERMAEELEEKAQDAINELESAVRAQCQKAAADGPFAEHAALNSIRAQLRQQFQNLQQAPLAPWTSADSAVAKNAANLLRRLAKPSGLFGRLKTLVAVFARWFTGRDFRRPAIQRAHLRLVEEKAQRRLQHCLANHQSSVYQHFLGGDSFQGLLDALQKRVDATVRSLNALAEKPAPAAPLDAEHPHELYLLRSLDDVVDDHAQRTVFDVVLEILARQNCTPAAVARRIRNTGIIINGQRYQLRDWTRVDFALLRRSLHKSIARLTAPAIDTTLAELHLLHPIFQKRLATLMKTWSNRARPYVDIAHTGEAPKEHNFLYCFPAHRAAWAERLANLDLAPVNAEDFRTEHGFIAILCRSKLAISPASLRRLPYYLRKLNELKRNARFQPLFDPAALPELRPLPDRPTDYEATEAIFAAGCKAGIIQRATVKATTVGFVLADCPLALKPLFAPAQLVPQSLPPQAFKRLLSDRDFIFFVQVTFALPDFEETAARLSDEYDDLVVADELERLGIVTASSGAVRFLKIKGLPKSRRFPAALYAVGQGPLVGLTRDEFLAAVLKNDLLYRFLVWRIVDAVTLHVLTPHDVPEFLRKLAEMQ